MKSYEEIVEDLGGFPIWVEQRYSWRAYKDGKCLIFSDKKSAYSYSNLVERFIINQEEYDLNEESHSDFKDAVQFDWETEQWSEVTDISFKVFKFCLLKAYGEYNIHESENAREIIVDSLNENIIFAKELFLLID